MVHMSIAGHSETRPALRGRAVPITFGTTAYITHYRCGASCPKSELAFDYRGNRYDIQAKGADAELIDLANDLVPLSRLYP